MHPVLLQTRLFGILSEPWSLHTYGVLIAFGFVLAMALAARRARIEGERPEIVIDIAFYALLAGLAGARIVFVFTRLGYYLESPARILMIWLGGQVWYGGVIGAVLCVILYSRWRKLPFLKYADLLVPYMALGHAFGRLGCLGAGCCFGAPTSVPWGIVFPAGSMAHQEQQSLGLINFGDPALPVHPTQLYEAALELLLFAVLLAVRRKKSFAGQLLLIWVMVYAVGRSIIEVFRGDSERGVYILSTSQFISIAVFAAAVGLYGCLSAKRERWGEAAGEDAAQGVSTDARR